MSRKGFSVELQALRGLAALIVLAAHCASAIALPGGVGPLRFILNSGGAVVFFFVLSGFVLALSLQSRPATPQNTVSYYIRRGFRIYPALIVATILGTLICNHLALRADLSFGSDWLNIFYQQRIDGRKFVQAAAGLSAAANPPAWSILVELICSAILPLLVFTTRGPASAIAWAVALTSVSFLVGPHTVYAVGVYPIHFFAGATIPLWGPAFAQAVARAGAWATPALLSLCALVFFTARAGFLHELGHHHPLTAFVELLVTVPAIAIIYYGGKGIPALRTPVFAFLGDISYSLYLLHFPIMVALLVIASATFGAAAIAQAPVLATFALVGATMAVSLAMSALVYAFVEKPFIVVGRQLAGWSSPVVTRTLIGVRRSPRRADTSR
jgi:peptidoglycan/LPS O-acetylase OafA/YrhL